MENTRRYAFLSYNITSEDGVDGNGKLPIGRHFDFIGDVETELMILNDGDESLCLGYRNVEFYEDVYIGDMVDYTAELIKSGNTSRTCRIAVYKIASHNIKKPGCYEYFDEPKMVAEGQVILVVKKEFQRGPQPSGEVKEPWFEINY